MFLKKFFRPHLTMERLGGLYRHMNRYMENEDKDARNARKGIKEEET